MKFNCYFPMEIDDEALLEAINEQSSPDVNFPSLDKVPIEMIKEVIWDEFLNDYVTFDPERGDIEID